MSEPTLPPYMMNAIKVAEQIGKIRVDVGKIACKVPLATDYIKKMELHAKIGVKKKKCIC